MEIIDAVAHIGITVEDLERSVKFYCENFGFNYLRGAHFSRPFFEKNHSLYHLSPETTQCHTAVLESPDHNMQLELFRFTNHLAPEQTPWNRCGFTHFAMTTSDVPSMVAQLQKNNVEFCIDMDVRPDGGHWVFVRDPDGNLIEIMEPFRFKQSQQL